MNYQESLELLQQVCNDLIRSQQHPSIAFAAKPKIEEALVSFNSCIEEAKQALPLRDKVDAQSEEIAWKQDTINNLQLELNELKSTHLAAEHGKAFEPLDVEEVNLDNGGWIENNGHCPFDEHGPRCNVDLIFGSGHDHANVNPFHYDWFLGDEKVFNPIKYWRLSCVEA